MQDGGNFRRELVGVGLVGMLRVGAPELIFGQDGRQLGPGRRRACVKRGDGAFFLRDWPMERTGSRSARKEKPGLSRGKEICFRVKILCSFASPWPGSL